jgi:predicted CoA-binding protein
MMTDLTSLLGEPGASVAVIGATDHTGKYGGIIYRDLKRRGLRVFAVNPYRETVDGDPCWKTVLDLPETPTIADFVIPARRGLEVVDDCQQAGIVNIWLQPGAESPELMEKLDAGPFNWLAHACIMVRAAIAG